MRTLEYYTYTGSEVVAKALNALATFFTTATFGSFLQICLGLGLISSLFMFMLSRNPKDLIKWGAVFFLVPLLLINMKARVLVIDKTEPGKFFTVDNVPYLVALPTYFFSTVMVGMAEGVEAIFTTSDDERYGRTGMMFGSELYQLSRQSSVQEVALKKIWNDYFDNCMIGDVQINNKYSWDTLFSSPDIFAMLDTVRQSPLRAVFLDEGAGKMSFKTCAQVYPIVRKRFTDAAGGNLTALAHHLLGKNAAKYKPQIALSLKRSYDKYVNISTSASNNIRQNMVMNEVRYNLDRLDPTQSALNYAYTQNKLQTTSMWASLGLMAREYLPMLHTLIFMLFACLGFFIAGAAVIPGLTALVLKNYVSTFAYLSTWPTLFAIINALQLWGLESLSTDVSGRFGGLVLSNANAMDELHSRFAWMTGILMISVPAIAGGLLKGGQAVMSSMNYQLAGMINSTNARASAAAASGNLDFGNMQMDNHSMNTTNANKFDDNTLTNTGHTYTQKGDGSVSTQHPDGRTTYDSSQTTSRGNISANTQAMVQETVQNARSSTQQSLDQTTTQLGQSLNAGMALNERWNDSVSKNLSYGEGGSTGVSSQVSEGMSNMQSAIDNVSQNNSWTKDQSRAYLQSVHGGADAGFGLGGKSGVGGPSPFSFGVSGGVKFSDEERTAYSNMSAEQQQQLEQATQQYSEGATTVANAASQIDHKDTRSDVEQYAHDFALNMQNTQSLTTSAMNSQSQLEALSETQTRLDSGSSSFSANSIQGFQNYLETDVRLKEPDVKRLMTAFQPEDIADAKEQRQYYTRTEAFASIAGFEGDNGAKIKRMESDYQTDATQGGEKPALSRGQRGLMDKEGERVQSAFEATTEAVLSAKQTGALYNDEYFEGTKQSVYNQQERAQQDIAPLESMIDIRIKPEVEAELNPERTEYVSSDQAYPAAPAYTKNPTQQ